MTKITNKEILKSCQGFTAKRFFKRNASGLIKGEGLEVVGKTSKMNKEGNRTVVLLTLKDGRRIRYTIEIERIGRIEHGKLVWRS